MTDRELIEMSAKAAGYKLRGSKYLSFFREDPDFVGEWNPLADDGDALRLAVRLKMNIYSGKQKVHVEILSDSDEPNILITMLHKDDSLAATRCAIVHAAAEIGKQIGWEA